MTALKTKKMKNQVLNFADLKHSRRLKITFTLRISMPKIFWVLNFRTQVQVSSLDHSFGLKLS